MPVTSLTLQRMLLQAWEATPDAFAFRDTLVGLELQQNALVSAGTVTGSSGSGKQTSLAPARQGEKTLLETADAWTQLRGLYDSIKAIQLSLTPPGKVDDQTIYNLMNVAPEVRGIQGYTSNWMFLSK